MKILKNAIIGSGGAILGAGLLALGFYLFQVFSGGVSKQDLVKLHDLIPTAQITTPSTATPLLESSLAQQTPTVTRTVSRFCTINPKVVDVNYRPGAGFNEDMAKTLMGTFYDLDVTIENLKDCNLASLGLKLEGGMREAIEGIFTLNPDGLLRAVFNNIYLVLGENRLSLAVEYSDAYSHYGHGVPFSVDIPIPPTPTPFVAEKVDGRKMLLTYDSAYQIFQKSGTFYRPQIACREKEPYLTSFVFFPFNNAEFVCHIFYSSSEDGGDEGILNIVGVYRSQKEAEEEWISSFKLAEKYLPSQIVIPKIGDVSRGYVSSYTDKGLRHDASLIYFRSGRIVGILSGYNTNGKPDVNIPIMVELVKLNEQLIRRELQNPTGPTQLDYSRH